MQITTLGNNEITVCAKCDELIVVKVADAVGRFNEIRAAFDRHISENGKCKEYYDSLPTLEETLAELRRIEEERHASHICTPATCQCECGCGLQVKCYDDLSNFLCWCCELRVLRGDDEHGLIEIGETP